MATISHSDLLDSAPEACARAPGLLRRNGCRCSPDGPLQAGETALGGNIGLLLHHAPQPIAAGVEVRGARGPFLLRHELGDLPPQEILHQLSCMSWGGVLHQYHIVQVIVLLQPGVSGPPPGWSHTRWCRSSLQRVQNEGALCAHCMVPYRRPSQMQDVCFLAPEELQQNWMR